MYMSQKRFNFSLELVFVSLILNQHIEEWSFMGESGTCTTVSYYTYAFFFQYSLYGGK